MNALSNGSTFNTDEAKTIKFFPTSEWNQLYLKIFLSLNFVIYSKQNLNSTHRSNGIYHEMKMYIFLAIRPILQHRVTDIVWDALYNYFNWMKR